MKSVLISNKPKWCEKICHEIGKDETGKPIYEKRIEVRKSAPKEVPFKAYIYATRPKKFYKCGAIRMSDEWLWLANGKVEMGDGFKFWANGDEYQCLNGRIIGEFICDRIDEYKYVYCDHPEIGYPVGYDCGDNWYDIDEEDLQKACLTEEEFKRYGNGKLLYGWHISNLKIYDKPKELNEFYRICKKSCKPSKGKIFCLTTKSLKKNGCDGKIPLNRPPQSYMFVEEVKK